MAEGHFGCLVGTVLLLYAGCAPAETVQLDSPALLGNLELSADQLKKIQEAVTQAMNGKLDAEIECGEATQDCLVRAVRQWSHEGSTLREILVTVHGQGHASFTVEKPQGKSWPVIAAQSVADKSARK